MAPAARYPMLRQESSAFPSVPDARTYDANHGGVVTGGEALKQLMQEMEADFGHHYQVVVSNIVRIPDPSFRTGLKTSIDSMAILHRDMVSNLTDAAAAGPDPSPSDHDRRVTELEQQLAEARQTVHRLQQVCRETRLEMEQLRSRQQTQSTSIIPTPTREARARMRELIKQARKAGSKVAKKQMKKPTKMQRKRQEARKQGWDWESGPEETRMVSNLPNLF